MKKDKIKDRIAGAMYGVAVGDALGGPVEFMTRGEIQERYGVVTSMIGGGWLNLEPGETTDDTAMTLAVAEGIMDAGENYKDVGTVAKNIGQNFIDWYNTNPKDVGGTCAAAISTIDTFGVNRLESWMDAARMYHLQHNGKSGGNGSLMRTVPIALAYQPNEAYKMARAISMMTHWDNKVTVLVANYTKVISIIITGCTAAIDSLIFQYKNMGEVKPSGYAPESLNAALWAIENTDSFEEALVKAVNLGGDADTIGAITGGLAGAYYGINAIPARWKAAIHSQICEKIDDFVKWSMKAEG